MLHGKRFCVTVYFTSNISSMDDASMWLLIRGRTLKHPFVSILFLRLAGFFSDYVRHKNWLKCFLTNVVECKMFYSNAALVFLKMLSRWFPQTKATCLFVSFAFRQGLHSSPMKEWKFSNEDFSLALWMRGVLAAAFSCEWCYPFLLFL